MLKIGLTGGIGSGKTTVAKIFELLGVPVYYADDAAKRLMNEDRDLQNLVRHHFGEEVFENNILNRKLLASLVFNHAEKTKLLNSLVHPVTIADAETWMKSQENKVPYVIKEAALIFESDSHKSLDHVIGVDTPLPLRLSRTMKRDNISSQEVEARMQRQMNEEEKMKRCDFVIHNDERSLLIPQVITIHEKLLQLQNSL